MSRLSRRAISYLRWSSKKQRLGDSARRQLAKAIKYCERNGLTLDDTLRLVDDGSSAFRSKNAVEGYLGVFLQLIKDGDVVAGDTLIIESLDRLSRDKMNVALRLFLQIIDAGVIIVTLDPERVHNLETINDTIGLIEPILIMCRANEESERKSGFTKAYQEKYRNEAREAHRDRLARPADEPVYKARKGKCPWWIRVVDGKYEFIPANAAAIQKLFDLKEKGLPRRELLMALNADPTVVKPPRLGAWCRATIYKLLRERQVLGEYQPCKLVEGKRVPDGELLPDHYPAIISVDQWHRVNGMNLNKAKGRAPARHHVNLFSHILCDMRDDSPMHLTTLNGPKGKLTPYLIANSTVNNLPGNGKTMLRYEILERVILRHVKDIDPRRFQKKTDGDKLLLEARGVLAETKHQIRDVKDQYKVKRGKRLLELLGELEDTERLQAVLVEQLETASRTHANEVLTQLQSLVETLDSHPAEQHDLRLQIKARLRTLVKRIDLLQDRSAKKGRYNRLFYRCLAHVRFFDGSDQYLQFDQDGTLIGHGDSEKVTPRDRYEDLQDWLKECGLPGEDIAKHGNDDVPPPRKQGEKRNSQSHIAP